MKRRSPAQTGSSLRPFIGVLPLPDGQAVRPGQPRSTWQLSTVCSRFAQVEEFVASMQALKSTFSLPGHESNTPLQPVKPH